MADLLPVRFLFRYSIPAKYIRRLPRSGRALLGLGSQFAIPDFGELDSARSFADLRVGWNERGLGISAEVRGKRAKPKCDFRTPDRSDGVQVWIDTRNTQSIHRASRFCHHFCLLPAGAQKPAGGPFAVQLPIARAREETPLADPSKIELAVTPFADGYRLEAWLPAQVLSGYDPEAQPRLGFYYLIRDDELGEQTLSVGADFPFAYDPSLWGTLDLVR